MEIELTYRFSELDKEHQFGIVILNQRDFTENYFRWMWFYMGVYLGEKRPAIYPYSIGKETYFKGKNLKKYKYCNDANRQAKLLCRRIISITTNQ